MKHARIAALFFALAAVAWVVVAVLQPAYRIMFGVLALLNLLSAVMYYRRHRSRRSE